MTNAIRRETLRFDSGYEVDVWDDGMVVIEVDGHYCILSSNEFDSIIALKQKMTGHKSNYIEIRVTS